MNFVPERVFSLVLDAVSILGGDELPVDKWNVDICITASQKAIAAPPGVAPISVSKKAKQYIESNPAPTQYLNIKRYFKYYEDNYETPFTPALPLFCAFKEALDIILEEGLQNRIKRHKQCANALYSGLLALGMSPFAKPDARSNLVLAFTYPSGLDDKKFRGILAREFRVLVAGGFGPLKGKVFRIGSMGEVGRYHVIRTLSSIEACLDILGLPENKEAIAKALENFDSQS